MRLCQCVVALDCKEVSNMDVEGITLVATALITFIQVVASAYKKLRDAIKVAKGK